MAPGRLEARDAACFTPSVLGHGVITQPEPWIAGGGLTAPLAESLVAWRREAEEMAILERDERERTAACHGLE